MNHRPPPAVQELFVRVQRGNPDVAAAVMIDGVGTVVASGGGEGPLVTASTALMMPLRDLLERAAAELGCGGLRSTLLEGEDGYIALADVDGERTVAVVGVRHAAPGSLLSDAKWLAQTLMVQEAA